MTILHNQQAPEFDEDPELDTFDRAQPIGFEPSDDFVVLTQQDGCPDNSYHCILIERRDLQELIALLLDEVL